MNLICKTFLHSPELLPQISAWHWLIQSDSNCLVSPIIQPIPRSYKYSFIVATTFHKIPLAVVAVNSTPSSTIFIVLLCTRDEKVKLLMKLHFRHCGAWSIPISRSYLSSPNKLRTQFLWRFWKKLQFSWTWSQALSRRKRVMVIIPCCRTFLSADQLQRAVNAVSTKNPDFSRETSGKYRTTQTMKLFVTFHCW